VVGRGKVAWGGDGYGYFASANGWDLWVGEEWGGLRFEAKGGGLGVSEVR
jgi:hypothetical protein